MALASRPAGNNAHRSIGGRLQSANRRTTAPLSSSGVNIRSDAIAIPISASTAARSPSAALTRNRPPTATDAVAPLAFWKVQMAVS